MGASVQRLNIADQIREVLASRIVGGTYKPGDRLKELHLAREFQTSQGPVREALKALEAMRLIEIEPHRGSRVRGVSRREFREAYEVRAALEELAARLAAGGFERDASRLQGALRGMRHAAIDENLDEFSQHDFAFHRAIMETADNRVLLDTWERLGNHVRTRQNLAFAGDRLPELAERHVPILEALARGDGEAAGKILRNHFLIMLPAGDE